MNRTLSLIVAATLLALGCYMQVATHIRHELQYREETRVRDELRYTVVNPTKGRRAATGAVIGATAGGLAATALGGIGVVVAGTGFGLPAGAVLIGVGALLGGATGGTIGAASGNGSTYALYYAKVQYKVLIPHNVDVVEKSYPGNVGVIVLGLGLFVFGCAVVTFFRRREQGGAAPAI